MSYTKNSSLSQTICKIEIVKLADVQSISTILGIATVTLKTGKAWQDFYFAPNTGKLKKQTEITTAGKVYNAEASCFYPGLVPQNELTLESDTLAKWLLKVTLSDGGKFLMGQKHNGVTFSDDFDSADSGQKVSFVYNSNKPLRKIL